MSVRLNVGSGQRKFGPAGGWINVDCQPRWEPDICCAAGHIPLDDNYADCVVLHHCAEHMTLDASKEAFREAYRLLRPGGSLLVFVPDLRELTRAWMEGRISDYIFCVNLHGAWMGDEADLHRWSYTHETLSAHLMNSCAWRQVMPFDWREIEGMCAAKDWWILAVEAIK